MNCPKNNSKAFIATLDAAVALITIIAAAGLLQQQAQNAQAGALERLLAFQQAQDIVEACAAKNDLSGNCFDFLTIANPELGYCLSNKYNSCTPGLATVERQDFSFTIYHKQNP